MDANKTGEKEYSHTVLTSVQQIDFCPKCGRETMKRRYSEDGYHNFVEVSCEVHGKIRMPNL